MTPAALPLTTAVIDEGMAEGLHVGAQLAVSLHGNPVADLAVGDAAPGRPMTVDTLMPWMSATKLVTAVAVAQQWERGELDLDERVADHIPSFASNGKSSVTIRHLLTHTGGLRGADVLVDQVGEQGWDAVVAAVCAAPLEADWVPGRRAGYHTHAGHVILGELVRLIDGRPFDRYAREAILEPLGAVDYWIGIPADRYARYGDRIGVMQVTGRGKEPGPLRSFDSAAAAAESWPSRSGRGPAHDLLRVLELLAGRGERDGVRLLQPQTVDAMAAHQRVGMHDETFGVVMDFGLGLVLDTKYALGDRLQPYGYGARASSRAFGHSGAQSSTAFVDPEHGLCAALVFNGMCGEGANTRRQHAVLTALYDDLQLS